MKTAHDHDSNRSSRLDHDSNRSSRPDHDSIRPSRPDHSLIECGFGPRSRVIRRFPFAPYGRTVPFFSPTRTLTNRRHSKIRACPTDGLTAVENVAVRPLLRSRDIISNESFRRVFSRSLIAARHDRYLSVSDRRRKPYAKLFSKLPAAR